MEEKDKSGKLWIVVGIVAAVVLLAIVGAIVATVLRKKDKYKDKKWLRIMQIVCWVIVGVTVGGFGVFFMVSW